MTLKSCCRKEGKQVLIDETCLQDDQVNACFFLQGSCVVSTFARESLLRHNIPTTQFSKYRLKGVVSVGSFKKRRLFLPGCEMTVSPGSQPQIATLMEMSPSWILMAQTLQFYE